MPHPNSPTRSPFSSRKNSSQTKRERERDVFRVLCCFCLVFFCFLLHRRSLRESRKHTEVSRSISSSSSSSPASLFFSSSSSLIPHTRKQTHTSKKKTLANAGKRYSISRADEFLQIQTQNQKPTQTNKKERKQQKARKQTRKLASYLQAPSNLSSKNPTKKKKRNKQNSTQNQGRLLSNNSEQQQKQQQQQQQQQ
jgi:hypothetical protein